MLRFENPVKITFAVKNDRIQYILKKGKLQKFSLKFEIAFFNLKFPSIKFLSWKQNILQQEKKQGIDKNIIFSVKDLSTYNI